MDQGDAILWWSLEGESEQNHVAMGGGIWLKRINDTCPRKVAPALGAAHKFPLH